MTKAIDISQVKPEALNHFFSNILRQCAIAKNDEQFMKEYQEYKKQEEKNNEKI